MKRCFEQGDVHVIDCPVDYSENVSILNQIIREQSAKV